MSAHKRCRQRCSTQQSSPLFRFSIQTISITLSAQTRISSSIRCSESRGFTAVATYNSNRQGVVCSSSTTHHAIQEAVQAGADREPEVLRGESSSELQQGILTHPAPRRTEVHDTTRHQKSTSSLHCAVYLVL